MSEESVAYLFLLFTLFETGSICSSLLYCPGFLTCELLESLGLHMLPYLDLHMFWRLKLRSSHLHSMHNTH